VGAFSNNGNSLLIYLARWQHMHLINHNSTLLQLHFLWMKKQFKNLNSFIFYFSLQEHFLTKLIYSLNFKMNIFSLNLRYSYFMFNWNSLKLLILINLLQKLILTASRWQCSFWKIGDLCICLDMSFNIWTNVTANFFHLNSLQRTTLKKHQCHRCQFTTKISILINKNGLRLSLKLHHFLVVKICCVNRFSVALYMLNVVPHKDVLFQFLQWGSITHQMPAPFPGLGWCVLFPLHFFSRRISCISF